MKIEVPDRLGSQAALSRALGPGMTERASERPGKAPEASTELALFALARRCGRCWRHENRLAEEKTSRHRQPRRRPKSHGGVSKTDAASPGGLAEEERHPAHCSGGSSARTTNEGGRGVVRGPRRPSVRPSSPAAPADHRPSRSPSSMPPADGAARPPGSLCCPPPRRPRAHAPHGSTEDRRRPARQEETPG
ncbi:hypothetical protein THAOC_24100, partial [Thalassiosira oceanica]